MYHIRLSEPCSADTDCTFFTYIQQQFKLIVTTVEDIIQNQPHSYNYYYYLFISFFEVTCYHFSSSGYPPMNQTIHINLINNIFTKHSANSNKYNPWKSNKTFQ